MHPTTPRSPDALLYRYLEMRESITSPRNMGGLAWVPGSRCDAEQCDGRKWEYGHGGHRRCAKCHARWPEERGRVTANSKRSSTAANLIHVHPHKPVGRNIEGPLADLADLGLLIGSPPLLDRRAWFLCTTGGCGYDDLPSRGEANAPIGPMESVQQAVARYCRWRWSAQAGGWNPNAHEITVRAQDARRQVEKEAKWRARAG